MDHSRKVLLLVIILALGTAAIFIADVLTPLGPAVWTPYILISSLAVFARNPRFTYILAASITFLIVLGYFLSPSDLADHSIIFFNRSFGVITVWVVAYIGNRIIMSQAELEEEQRKVNLLNSHLEREAWIDRANSELSDILRKAERVDEICQESLSYLAEYVQAKVGVCYLFDDVKTLHLQGRYAIGEGKEKSQITLNEGYIGQAAAQQKTLRVDNLPSGYLNLSSATGQTSLTHIMVVPLIAKGALLGVIELGSLKEFSDVDESLLNLVSQSIAEALILLKHRIRTVELLEETQRQAEELQSQQEELRVANEELHEQTNALEMARSELEKQHASLEESNADLEQQQLNLEESKRKLETLNKELVASRERLNQKARELQAASQYKSEFLANMSHELRTPLNSILLLSQILSENRAENLSEEQIDFANTIHSSGNDLLNLINDILDLSKIEAGKVDLQLDDVMLTELLPNLASVFELAAREKGLNFRLDMRDVPPIYTDQRRLEQILKNFLSNAIKFTHRGRVELKLWSEEISGKKRVAIAVKDTGIGISEEKKELIFQAFQQADGSTERVYGGTGLGLSIAKELAKLLQSNIEVESQAGQGSTFTLFLPIAVSSDEDAEVAFRLVEKKDLDLGPVSAVKPELIKPVSSNESDAGNPRSADFADDRNDLTQDCQIIQVIEDDPKFANLIAKHARERGLRCILSENGELGVADALNYLPRGIILDLKLPGLSGMGVLERLKKDPKTRHIPVHIISGSEQGRSALYMGAVGFLMKPVEPNSLRQAFAKIEQQHDRAVKTVLVVEDDKNQLKSMKAFIEEGGKIEVIGVRNGQEALEKLEKSTFDLMILDIHLPGMSGFEILEAMAADDAMSHPPVIVYTGKRLSQAEEDRLRQYVDTIIIKSARSPERLLDEMTLFLHKVVAELPREKQKVLKEIQLKDEILEGTTILLVDDDVRNVYAISYLLEQRGVKVEIARNGREALNALDRHPKIDLVLMDIMMPVMDGYQAMRAIRTQDKFRKLPIIALTAKSMKGDQEKCYEAGANDYASKPIDAQRLISLVKVWLAPRGF